jgi:hypothetical protein
MRRPSQRRRHLNSVVRARVKESNRCFGLSQELLAEKARKNLPDYGKFGVYAQVAQSRQRRGFSRG